MARMGRYCKAYALQDLRAFEGWTENSQNARKEKKQMDGKEVEIQRELADDSYVYLQENFVVTDGIFIDENILFDNTSPEWVDFCKNSLKFEVPLYDTAQAAGAE
ncbi:MAG TPA: hypothetical protein VF131_04815 [Blastocatellia bacterium]|nr:hypothetical protein [Blastocatellia bacterium]